jgi:hypothetical protein
MFIENNPVITVYNYHQQDLKFSEDQIGPTYKTWQQGDIRFRYEKDLYDPFAHWLVNELRECTKAIPLGGKIFRDKWGTPDVIGIRESKKSHIIQFPTEIISAEVKIDSKGLITAFGQACAYRIFSHKSYIVVPDDSNVEDIIRLDVLCRLYGIGFVLFNRSKINTPRFEIRSRAIRNDPDMFFVNKNLKLIEDRLFK